MRLFEILCSWNRGKIADCSPRGAPMCPVAFTTPEKGSRNITSRLEVVTESQYAQFALIGPNSADYRGRLRFQLPALEVVPNHFSIAPTLLLVSTQMIRTSVYWLGYDVALLILKLFILSEWQC